MNKKIIFTIFLAIFCFSVATAVVAQTVGGVTVQTNQATNILESQATLNGSLGVPYLGSSNLVWFQWGLTSSYGNQTTVQTLTNSGSFSQTIYNLASNTTFHFRAAVQNNYGTTYGQDLTFTTNSSGIYNNYVQTSQASNISNNQATLNGHLSGTNQYNNYVWFQWGTTTGYGNQTAQQNLTINGPFSQTITGLLAYTTYHYRAVLQGSNGTSYGQDMTFYTSGSGTGYNNITITKKVINLTSGNLSWAPSVYANPGDILSFSVTLQNNNQDVHNVLVRDSLATNMIYRGNLTVNTSTSYSGDILSGINIGTVYANQPVIVAYQVQVAPATNFVYGTTTLTNNATVTGNEVGTQTASAIVLVNRTSVSGATDISTGLTNNILVDSFFVPFILIMLGAWLYFSKNIYKIADRIKTLVKK